ncbi:unnamed protein product [Cylindrotheca closterium]|uniref:Fumarylacetoacetase-like C-terminal domain-containing protein n=1 Tax=Cylindrotheca closterium TaxID=2856 RepID=A0AAD2CLB1_9STRA|nr:unnamed protein product [Cylindrotheca closterium]
MWKTSTSSLRTIAFRTTTGFKNTGITSFPIRLTKATPSVVTNMTTSRAASSSSFVFPPPPTPSVEIHGSDQRFPVHRVYCVGRNYADHVREMGGDPNMSQPIFFTKPANAIVPTNTKIPYPLATTNLHYEVELVVAIGQEGVKIPIAKASDYIFGYATGIDLTRRDLQNLSKDKGLPWDTAKALDQGAPISAITPIRNISSGGDDDDDDSSSFSLDVTSKISLTVNGEPKQEGTLNQMIWTVEEVISHLSHMFTLQPGDLIYTGTPKGVGPIVAGDHVKAMIEGLETVEMALTKSDT